MPNRAGDCVAGRHELAHRLHLSLRMDNKINSEIAPADSSKADRKIRYAVVGAGWIAQAVFMPGVEPTKNSVLTAIITGDAEKAHALAEKYAIEHVYGY